MTPLVWLWWEIVTALHWLANGPSDQWDGETWL